jgi:hypothetical protein
MKKLFVIGVLMFIAACSTEKKQGNMVVQGQIEGLKKGTLYLQKMVDTLVVSVDSVSVLGLDTFTLSDNVESPEMYYLTFDTNSSEQKIMFFGEQGTITITDDVRNFGVDTKIEGSANQKVYEDYKKITKRFQGKQLDLVAENFKAQKENNQQKSDSLRTVSEGYLKRKYLYTINFALNHPDSEAAAYITLTELANANIKYLDSINNRLSDKVKNSTYGKQLDKFIANIKATE